MKSNPHPPAATSATDSSVTAVLNPRIAHVRESATLAINQKARALRSAGADIAHFGFGESPFPPPPPLVRALADNASRKSYLPGLGLPELRRAIAAFYCKYAGYDFQEERIAIGPGSKELIFHLLYLLQGPLILPAPSWVSYAPQAALLGKEVIFVPTTRTSAWKLDAAALAATKMPAGQKILILNSPNNPTGQVFNETELQALAEVCRAHDIIVIADEIYAQVDYTRILSPGLGTFCPERVIVTGGLSKAYSAGGWRVGFAAACTDHLRRVFAALAVIISETYSCVCAPAQAAAVTAYCDDPAVNDYVRDCARIHAAIVNFAAERLSAGGVHCLAAAGGFYLFPDFDNFTTALQKRGITSATALANALLAEARVTTLPGDDFGIRSGYALRLAPVDYDGGEVYAAYKKHGAAHLLANANTYIPRVAAGCARLCQWAEALHT